MPRLILGSSSPARKQLLDRFDLAYEVVAPEIDETPYPGEGAEAMVKRLAEQKAARVAVLLDDDQAVIVAADLALSCAGEIFGKPGDHDDAVNYLRYMSGKAVTFYCGMCVRYGADFTIDVVETQVTYRVLDDAAIERYLSADTPYKCAGSFKQESRGLSILERVQSDDPSALVGLPLIRLCERLRALDIEV